MREKNGLTDITKDIEPHGWYHFKDATVFTETEFLNLQSTNLGLSKNDKLKEIRRKFDEKTKDLCIEFQQYYKDIPIELTIFKLHFIDNKPYQAHGLIAEDLNIDVKNVIKENDALNFAFTTLPAKL